VAVVDVGSNSIKLLVARQGEAPGSVETIFVETIETRISAGISRTIPSLSETAIRAGAASIAELVRMAREYEPETIRIVATSAVRDAVNGDEFIESVRNATGLTIRILSGGEEASLIGRGLSVDPQVAGVRDFFQVDIGGGSLELIRFRHRGIERALSLQLGAVRMTERFVRDRESAIDEATVQELSAHVRGEIERSGFDFEPTDEPLIATGGAFSVTRAVLAAEREKPIEAYSALLGREEFSRLRKLLCALPLHERMAVPHLPAARADVMPAALITIEALLDRARRDAVTHSFYNLRYGVAAECLAAPAAG